VTVQGFVRDHGPMIAAPVQGDVDGIAKGAHMNYETAKVLGTRRGHRERHRIRPAPVEVDVT